jgi:prolyl-tRNA synthetase
MYERAARDLQAHIVDIRAVGEAREMINRVGWCGDEACGKQVETDTGMSLLGTPYPAEPYEGKCISCGKPATTAAYVARTY